MRAQVTHESIIRWSSIITRNNRANTCSPPFPLMEVLPLLRVGLKLELEEEKKEADWLVVVVELRIKPLKIDFDGISIGCA